MKKIISGGQTGADRGGLIAGKALGIPTGGTAPKGWRTEIGHDESLKNFGLEEHSDWQYPPRTERNVIDSDGTLLVGNMNSAGCALTVRLCKAHSRPFIINPSAAELREWIGKNSIDVLNVAGNRESKNPGIEQRVVDLLVAALGG